MKKKIVAMCATVAIAALAVGGTVAYFADSEKATNTFTVGNVSINLEEYAKIGGEKVAFSSETALPLLPMTDEQGVVMDSNKTIDIVNDGTSPAYVRALVAFEVIDPDNKFDKTTHTRVYTGNTYANETSKTYGADNYGVFVDTIAIGETTYDVYAYDTCEGEAIPVGYKMESVQAIWLDAALDNEDIKLGENGKFDVLVVAQGVQADSFETHDEAFAAAFPLTNANLVEWFSAADNAKING